VRRFCSQVHRGIHSQTTTSPPQKCVSPEFCVPPHDVSPRCKFHSIRPLGTNHRRKSGESRRGYLLSWHKSPHAPRFRLAFDHRFTVTSRSCILHTRASCLSSLWSLRNTSQNDNALRCHTDDLLGITFKRPRSGVLAAVEYSRTNFYAHWFVNPRGISACLSRQFAHFGSLGTVWFVWVRVFSPGWLFDSPSWRGHQ